MRHETRHLRRRRQRGAAVLAAGAILLGAAGLARCERIKDIVEIQGVRGNPLSGIGLVTGLAGTGDTSLLSRQMLTNILRDSGLVLSPTDLTGGNVAVVMYSGRLSDRIGRKPLLIIGLVLSAVTTLALGLATSLPLFFIEAVVAGAASGIYASPQQAAVADIIGKARGGTAIAAFQMMSDFGSIVGSFGVGLLAERLSYGWAFGVSGAILLLAAIGWAFAPETRDSGPGEHGPAPVGTEAAGELP